MLRIWNILRNVFVVLVVLASLGLGAITIVNTITDKQISLGPLTPLQLQILILPLLLVVTGIIIPMISINTYITDKVLEIAKANQQASGIIGIESFRPDRRGLPSIKEKITKASRDVLIVGIGIGSVSAAKSQGIFDDLLASHCDVRLLFLSTYTKQGKPNPVVEVADKQTLHSSNRRLINLQLRDLHDWRSGLDEAKKKHLQIRGYDNIPSTTAIVVDGDYGKSGHIHDLDC